MQENKKILNQLTYIKIALIVSFAINGFLLYEHFISNDSHSTNEVTFSKNETAEIDNTPIDIQGRISPEESRKIDLLLLDGRRISLLSFPLVEEVEDDVKDSLKSEFIDLDNDGVPELLTYYNLGGAHAIGSYSLFFKGADNVYEQILSVDDAEFPVKITKNGVYLTYGISYFHTGAGAPPQGKFEVSPTIHLKYKSNRLVYYTVANEELNNNIESNLKALKEKGIPPEEGGFDDGTREMFLNNIMAYYLNNNKDLSKSRDLFQKYYSSDDKEKLWNEMSTTWLLPASRKLQRVVKM